ncbi:hypothetical protein GGX14DRAFT_636360 [Mycena pura]|uniref:Uncharacterized protein n=1 Tax=Mycena pura TaxID=153505 RepID=A0AAD6VE16_9AGAR|nr:hypothetical protein GGX14DRAFT_636360 [Mycena pura]
MKYAFNVLLPDGENPVTRTIWVDHTTTFSQFLTAIVEGKYYGVGFGWEQKPTLHAPAPDLNKWGTQYPALSRLSEYFAEPPSPTEIHVVIVTSDLATQTHTRTRPPAEVQRSELVSYLYEAGKQLGLFLVRGTPGSGKTTVCWQLRNYILDNDSGARVTITKAWKQRDSVAASIQASYVDGDTFDPGYGGSQWLLLDDAQTTYEDVDLWAAFKDFPKNVFVICFASHGSQERDVTNIVATSESIQPHMRMGLRPTENGWPTLRNIPGLYFTREEYEQLLLIRQRLSELPKLIPDIKDWIFEVTNGHIGAISSILDVVTSMAKGPPRVDEMSMAGFFAKFSGPEDVFQVCSLGRAFARGIPSDKDLKNPSNIDSLGFCQKLLEADGPLFFEKHEIPDGAQQAHKRGWIMLDEVANSATQADFPSPFHRSRLSYLVALKNPERHVSGPGSKPSVSEAQYQNEFYRAAYQVTGGPGLWLSPEFGTGNKGNKTTKSVLNEGPIIRGTITDYVVLDCRRSRPITPFPQYPNLYHIVFTDEFARFQIINHQLFRKAPYYNKISIHLVASNLNIKSRINVGKFPPTGIACPASRQRLLEAHCNRHTFVVLVQHRIVAHLLKLDGSSSPNNRVVIING